MERPRCFIKKLSFIDTIGALSATLLFISMGILFGLISVYVGCRSLYTIWDKLPKLFSYNPDLIVCLYVVISFVITSLFMVFTYIYFKFGFDKLFNLITGNLYRLVFVDDNGRVIETKFETLTYLTKQGYDLSNYTYTNIKQETDNSDDI